MSSHCNIGVEHENGSISYVYCHFDGYPVNITRILTRFYNSYDSALALVELGELSCIGKTLDECKAYHRDFGEFYEVWNESDAEKMYLQEYNYLFRTVNNGWWIKKCTSPEWVQIDDNFNPAAWQLRLQLVRNAG
jgi:hypothetical protein